MYLPPNKGSRFGQMSNSHAQLLPKRAVNSAMDPVDWCNTKLRVGSDSPIPGRVTLHRLQEDPIRDMIDPRVTQTTLMAASQISKTFMESAACGYHIDQSPCAILICGPTGMYNRRFIATKLEPMFTANPELNDKITRNRLGNIPSTETTIFSGGSLSWATGKAPTTQKGHTSQLVMCDEVDEYTGLVDVDNPLDLLLHRGILFGARQRSVVASTPSVHQASLIEAEFLKGTMAEFFVPCGHCGNRSPMKWANVDCPEKPDEGEPPLPDEELYGRYICSECGAIWTEVDRRFSLSQGVWIPAVPDKTHHSYRLSQLCSPFVALMTSVKEYHSRSNKAFMTQVMAEPFDMAVMAAPDPQKLEYLYGVEPPDSRPNVVTVGVDVQGSYLELVVLGFWRGEEHIRVLSHQTVDRRGRVETAMDLYYALRSYDPDMIFIDESYETDEVWAYCALLNQYFFDKCFPVRGRSPSWNQAFTMTLNDSKFNKWLAVDSIKYTIYETLPKEGVWSIHRDSVISDRFLTGLVSEHIVQGLNNKITWEKLKPTTKNEVLDCVTYAWAGKRFRDARLLMRMNDE